MKSIVQIVKTVITNILIALYQPFWYAVVASVLLCFLYLYAYHPVDTGNGLRSAFKKWIEEFKRSIFFRRLFLLSFFTIMILFQTLFNRNMWDNPLSDVLGGWWIWDIVNGEKKLTTECLENLVLMLPFTFFLFLTFEEKMKKNSMKGIIGTGLNGNCVPDRASSKGRAIRQVEILSNKLLTTAFEASLECVTVM
jgi:hypothetical protein